VTEGPAAIARCRPFERSGSAGIRVVRASPSNTCGNPPIQRLSYIASSTCTAASDDWIPCFFPEFLERSPALRPAGRSSRSGCTVESRQPSGRALFDQLSNRSQRQFERRELHLGTSVWRQTPDAAADPSRQSLVSYSMLSRLPDVPGPCGVGPSTRHSHWSPGHSDVPFKPERKCGWGRAGPTISPRSCRCCGPPHRCRRAGHLIDNSRFFLLVYSTRGTRLDGAAAVAWFNRPPWQFFPARPHWAHRPGVVVRPRHRTASSSPVHAKVGSYAVDTAVLALRKRLATGSLSRRTGGSKNRLPVWAIDESSSGAAGVDHAGRFAHGARRHVELKRARLCFYL